MDDTNEADFKSLNSDLENYFTNTIIPQLFVDSRLILRKFTPPAMKQFSLSSKDIGRSVGDLVDNIRFSGITDNILHVIQTGEILEKEIQTTDRRWYQMNILPYIIGQTGVTNGVIMTFVDITTRINDLKELEKLISNHQILIDTISHDIKNPLTNIVLALEMLNEVPYDSPDLKAGLQIIERSTARIKAMVEDLNNMRKDSSVQNAEAELLNIENILEDVFVALTMQIQHSQAIFSVDIGVSEIIFSRRKLRTILYNLVSNAIKYRSAQRPCHIKISSVREKNGAMIIIADNGIGIEPANQEKIFNKYYRVQSELEGSGVGLYLVREIIYNAGGKITVQSVLGEGTTFSVYLENVQPDK